MGFIVSDTGGGGDYTPVPEGTHAAVCNMLVDLGVQETEYQGQKKVVQQIYIGWELPDNRIEWKDKDGNQHEGPMTIGKTYTKSLGEKANLRKDLTNWRGRAFTDEELAGFDLLNILGKPCQVTVAHIAKGEKTYANVTGLSGWQKRMGEPPQPERHVIKFSCDDDESEWENLPEWLRKKISARILPGQEAGHLNQAGDPGIDLNDEIPF